MTSKLERYGKKPTISIFVDFKTLLPILDIQCLVLEYCVLRCPCLDRRMAFKTSYFCTFCCHVVHSCELDHCRQVRIAQETWIANHFKDCTYCLQIGLCFEMVRQPRALIDRIRGKVQEEAVIHQIKRRRF